MQVEEWLGQDNQLGMDIWKNKYQNNGESFDQWLDRISAGNDQIRELIAPEEIPVWGQDFI